MSGHTQQKLSEGIVTSDAFHPKQRQISKWLWVGLVILLLAVAIISYEYFHVSSKQSSGAPVTQAKESTLTAQQQINAAITSANSELKDANNSTQKAEAYKSLGIAYYNKGEYQNAIIAYNAAIADNGLIKAEVLDNLAYCYVLAGQRDKAIATYQELITLVQPADTAHQALNTQQSAVQVYQHDIQVLQQGGTL